MNALEMPTTLIAAMSLSAAVMIVAPPVVAVWARRRLAARWTHFFLGALTFFLFQLVTRVPLVALAQVGLAERLEASVPLQWGWLAGLSLSAGLFEETGRYVCFRWFLRREQKSWDAAVMVGLGHGGLESMLLVGGAVIATLLTLLLLPAEVLVTLPPEASEELRALTEQSPWTIALGAAERLMALVLHVALSVTVVQVFLRGERRWLLVSILAHGLANTLVVSTMRLAGGEGLGATLAAEGAMLLVAVASAAWLVRTARRQRGDETSARSTAAS
ncbi:MAG TPA: YhfC family glutamic-type intramembrane protease [Sandaracinaceae bacterium LLY-WYZ-13_1]|nr:YhfC family glutamic-type intramembrane protease [Sandaracinaceae bacterium LLY-WYZ-13_1]